MKLILLGKLRSGKTRSKEILIDLIKKAHGVELETRSLAEPIYTIAKEIYVENGLVWRKNRRLLEGVGEALNEDWPGGDKIINLFNKTFDPEQHIIVDDCRRLTQAKYFTEKGATFIRIKANKEVRYNRCKPGEWAEGHSTDMELDDYPVQFEINNNGDSLGQLENMLLEKIVHKL